MKGKSVRKLDQTTGEILDIYENVALAAEEIECDTTDIYEAIKRKCVSSGYKWEYANEGDEITRYKKVKRKQRRNKALSKLEEKDINQKEKDYRVLKAKIDRNKESIQKGSIVKIVRISIDNEQKERISKEKGEVIGKYNNFFTVVVNGMRETHDYSEDVEVIC
ncbi:hypothetical protein CS063_16910 [Sporanaerobium hydrogeniformans]|uniref:Uncharacterized protein n=1 Tax=Sporanaerobium hydrogeniformans TaxID=3072179 RepID=A0AC61D7C7_9FIRM|nr:hypothetical protein [Sporanaerobium hydrogeniformans]PHV69222.1 hypothetical protein CS063_16910 [Sporanaerobium hydrogeniformans]